MTGEPGFKNRLISFYFSVAFPWSFHVPVSLFIKLPLYDYNRTFIIVVDYGMEKNPLFYKNIVPLDKIHHKKLYYDPLNNFNFTRDINSIYLAAVEFLKASREYPIVFGMNEGKYFPVALLGLIDHRNVFLDKEGNWKANYIPAYIRRYPFILATHSSAYQSFTICIDRDYPGFNDKKKGTRLFDQDGKESGLLKQIIDFMKEYQNHILLTESLCSSIAEADLFEPMQAVIGKTGGEKTLSGFYCVSRERLKELDDELLGRLIRSDHMELIYAHLASLANLDELLKHKEKTEH